MTRSVSSTTEAAVTVEDTRPIHLIRMAWGTELRAATYARNISWNSETWSASGAEVQGVDASGGILFLPNGEDDPWLNLVHTDIARGREIEIYEYHTDKSASPIASDAELIFFGVMDEVSITEKGIRIALIEGATNKVFPPTSIDVPDYNWLLPVGSRLFWGPDIVTTN